MKQGVREKRSENAAHKSEERKEHPTPKEIHVQHHLEKQQHQQHDKEHQESKRVVHEGNFQEQPVRTGGQHRKA